MVNTRGKGINPQTRVVDGNLCMLIARAKTRAIHTELYWDIRGAAEEPFTLVLALPGLGPDADPVYVSMPLDAAGGQAAYANHPRKVSPSQIPEDCPVYEILDQLDADGNPPWLPKRGPGRRKKTDD